MSTIIFADGASKNNPGEASAAAVVIKDGKVVAKYAKKLGVQTNNVAEYHGLLLALLAAREWSDPMIRMDSNLVVQQFLGAWKCKEPALRELLAQAHAIAKESFDTVNIEWVAREDNTHADQAGNDVLDGIIPEIVPHGYNGAIKMAPRNPHNEPVLFAEPEEYIQGNICEDVSSESKETFPVTRTGLRNLLKRARAASELDAESLIASFLQSASR